MNGLMEVLVVAWVYGKSNDDQGHSSLRTAVGTAVGELHNLLRCCSASLGGFGGVQCVPVGHPFNQAGWDQLALSGSQSAWLFFSLSFFSFFNYIPLNLVDTAQL